MEMNRAQQQLKRNWFDDEEVQHRNKDEFSRLIEIINGYGQLMEYRSPRQTWEYL
jgi:hypothetical protein